MVGKALWNLLKSGGLFIWELLKIIGKFFASKWVGIISVFITLFGCQPFSNIITDPSLKLTWDNLLTFFLHNLQWKNLLFFAGCSVILNIFGYIGDRLKKRTQDIAEVKALKKELNNTISILKGKFWYSNEAVGHPIFILDELVKNVPNSIKWFYHHLWLNKDTTHTYIGSILTSMTQALIQHGNLQNYQCVTNLYKYVPNNESLGKGKLKFIQLGPDVANLRRDDLSFEKDGYVDSDGNTILPGGPKAVELQNYQYIPDTTLPEYSGLFDCERVKSILAIPVFEKEIPGDGEIFAVVYFVSTVSNPFADEDTVKRLVIPSISSLLALLKYLHKLDIL
jgi:hypothetical protein